LFHTLYEITKIGDHFRCTTGKVNGWNVCIRQPIDDSIDCFACHDLLALWPGVNMAVHAGEIAKLANVDLKNLRSCTTQPQTVGGQSSGKGIHKLCVVSQ